MSKAEDDEIDRVIREDAVRRYKLQRAVDENLDNTLLPEQSGNFDREYYTRTGAAALIAMDMCDHTSIAEDNDIQTENLFDMESLTEAVRNWLDRHPEAGIA